MNSGKVSIQTLQCSPLYNKFLSPPHKLFTWALKKLIPLHLSRRKFQPLALMKLLLLNNQLRRLPLRRNQKFLSLKNLRLRFLKW